MVFNELTTFVGNNSSGKTAMIHALLKLFGKGNKSLVRSDFHLPSPDEMKSCKLYMEAICDFPELENDGELDNSVPAFFNHFVIDNIGESPYLRIRLDSIWEQGNTPEGTIDTEINFIVVPEHVEIEDEHKKRASNALLSKIECLYVPAIRNPREKLKNVTGSILHRVLSGLKWNEESKGRFVKEIEALNSLFLEEKRIQEMNRAIGENWNNYHNDARYSRASLSFENDNIAEFLKHVNVMFHLR